MTDATAAPPVVRLAAVDSTQAVAFALAEHGAADRTVVVADTQRCGRGRRGRAWHDTPGESLLTSIVLRPGDDPARWPSLSLLAAVAVAEALEAAGLAPRLKWPNDVLVDGRKIAGILLESRLGSAPIVVVGIGVNVGARAVPEALRDRATSIALAGGVADRETLLAALLARLDAWLARWRRDGFEPVRVCWRGLADTLGRRVTADGVSGVAVDVDPDGALVIDGGAGRQRIVAGEVGVEAAGAPGR